VDRGGDDHELVGDDLQFDGAHAVLLRDGVQFFLESEASRILSIPQDKVPLPRLVIGE
jgi:hypothetical protein